MNILASTNNQNKIKVLEIAKNFNIENEFKDLRKEGNLTEEESNLIKKSLRI